MKKLLIALTFLFAPLIAMPATVAAVDVVGPGVCNQSAGAGASNPQNSAVCRDSDTGAANPFYGQGGILTIVIGILSSVVAIVAVITIILSGLKFISSGNNPQEVSKAREQITYAAIALVVAGIAQAIVQFVLSKL